MMRCGNCNREFEQKENMLQYPHCGSLLPLEDIAISEIGAALRYIVLFGGKDILKNRGRVTSMLPDIYHGRPEDLRLIRYAYQIAEKEIASFVNAASAGRDPSAALTKLLCMLNYMYMEKRYMDQTVVAFLAAYELDADPYLGGEGHPVIDRLSHRLHAEELTDALRTLGQQQGTAIWESAPQALSMLQDANPALKDELRLLYSIANGAGAELSALMKCIWSAVYQEHEEKMPVALLQAKLRECFMDPDAIDFALEAILSSAGLKYTQQVYHPAGSGSANTTTPARPRKNGGTSAAGASTSGTAAGKGTGANNAGTAGSQTGRNAGGNTANNTSGKGGSGKTQPKKKKKFSFGKLLFYLLLLYLAYRFVINPWLSKRAGQKESATTEQTQEEVQDETQAESQSAGEEEVPTYTVTPEISTAVTQIGLYQTGNIASPSRYAEYTGADEIMHFHYPRVLYENVTLAYDNDGDDIDVEFTCSDDASYLYVSTHPASYYTDAESIDAEELKNTLFAEAEAGLKDVEVLNERQNMATMAAETQSSMIYTVRVRGYDAVDPDVVVYVLMRVSTSAVQQMILKYPVATDETDLALKEYYAQTMYDLCAFGGNTDYESWSDFKKSYNLD
ncbi:MAG: hypothetical protein LUG56_01215 [Lachnospiraceae bacterium]|nr:hypothetical protein [Lachnospiraceae bacterium]